MVDPVQGNVIYMYMQRGRGTVGKHLGRENILGGKTGGCVGVYNSQCANLGWEMSLVIRRRQWMEACMQDTSTFEIMEGGLTMI